VVSPFLPDDEKLAAVRESLPAVGAGIYLNTGTAGPLPAETAAVMAEMAAWELRTGRAHLDFFHEVLDRIEEARAAVAAVLSADIDQVALTNSTSHGMGIATWAVDWQPGDRAVTTTGEHAGGLGPLYALRDRLGIDLVHAEIGEGGDDERTMAAFDALVTPGTRLVSLSHVSWSSGAVLPVARIAALARSRGALVVVDGAQSAGAVPLDVPSLGVDFYAVPSQKWLLGPEGVAALWVSPDVIGQARLTMPAYFSYERYDSRGGATAWPTARRFDAANWYKPSIVGFARSVGWLGMYVGLEWVYSRSAGQARAMAGRLAGIPGVEVVTPRHQMATLVTFRIAGWDAQAALDELGARVFAIARTIPAMEALRISVGCFNSGAELERFSAAVGLLAAHTPGTLPPRRSLDILPEGVR
jgi:L-cysteine/cystine lyase